MAEKKTNRSHLDDVLDPFFIASTLAANGDDAPPPMPLGGGPAAGRPSLSLDDPAVRTLLGLGSPHEMPDDLIQQALMSGSAAQAGPAETSDPAVREQLGLMDEQGQQFADLRRRANAELPPAEPAQTEDRRAPVESWPGLLNPGKALQWAYDKLPEAPDMPNVPGTQYVSRSLEALGRAPGDVAEMGPQEMLENLNSAASFVGPGNPMGVFGSLAVAPPAVTRGAVTGNWKPIEEAFAARNAGIQKAAPHTLQVRGAGGRFGKFRDEEVQALRDEAKRRRAWERDHPMEYDDFGEPLGRKGWQELYGNDPKKRAP